MSQVEMTQLQWAGQNLRRAGKVLVETDEITAHARTDRYTVLYLRSGEKLFVLERLEDLLRGAALDLRHREIIKRFKRELRECKGLGMHVDHAFAALWEEVATREPLSDADLSGIYQELLEWTKRWLK